MPVDNALRYKISALFVCVTLLAAISTFSELLPFVVLSFLGDL